MSYSLHNCQFFSFFVLSARPGHSIISVLPPRLERDDPISMKSLTCPGCGAGLEPSCDSKFITCPYCGATSPNEYFEGDDAETELVYLEDVCIEYLCAVGDEMGADEIASSEFGTPIGGGRMLEKARENFDIPDEEEVYFIYDSTIFGGCQKGFALCSGGMYFCCDSSPSGDTGMYTWEEFIDEEISYEDGDLHIYAADFIIGSTADDLVDFLIELHDRVFEYWYADEQ